MKNIFDKLKNKKIIFGALGSALLVSLPTVIYFSQTAYFYHLPKNDLNKKSITDSTYAYSSEILNKHKRKHVETYPAKYSIDKYPWYQNDNFKNNHSTNGNDWKQNAVNDSNQYMKKEFIQNEIKNGTLKKHIAADYQYGYEHRIKDWQPAVTKRINIDVNRFAYVTTGLYLPPGEVLNIHFDGLTNEQIKQIKADLILADNEIDNWGINSNNTNWYYRMPVLRSQIEITNNDFKWGTPFGGIVSLLIRRETKQLLKEGKLSITISGAVETLHYIHGYTTEQEWFRLLRETDTPIADIGTDIINFIVPTQRLSNVYPKNGITPNKFDPKYYPYKTMDLFRKLSLDGYYSVNKTGWNIPNIRMNATNFVGSGNGYAGVNRYFVSMPWVWTTWVVDYEDLFKNGSFPLMHEFNHHNQDYDGMGIKPNDYWGFKGHGEVTNDVLLILGYIAYTNVYSNRDGTKDIPGGIAYEHNINGYKSQFVTNQNSKSFDQTTRRNGFPGDYTVITANFGKQKFQDLTRWYKGVSNNDYFGFKMNKFDEATEAQYDRHLKFVYFLSRITGYNWSQYYYDTGLLLKEDAIKINSLLEIDEKNMNNNKVYKPYAPLYSFLANEVKYGEESKEYVKTQSPFLLPKKYFSSGYPLDLEKDLITFVKTKNTTTETLYTVSNIKLIKGPKYGSLIKQESDTKFLYKPNLGKMNDIDQFEYSAEIIRNDAATNTSEDLLKNKNQKINVSFKVNIMLEGNEIELVTPDYKEDYQPYTPSILIDNFSKINSIHFDLKPGQKYWNEQTTIDKFISRTGSLQVYTDNGKENANEFIYKAKDEFHFNSFDFEFNDAEGRADFIEIIANGEKILPKTSIVENKNVFSFKTKETKAKEIKIVVTKSAATTGRRFIKLKRIDFAIKQDELNTRFKLSSNNTLLYGDWRNKLIDKFNYFGNETIFTIVPYVRAYFGFKGNSLVLYGTKDVGYGSFDLYIDDKFISTIDTHSSTRKENDILLLKDIDNIPDQNHIVKIVNKTNKPIELSGFSVRNNNSKLLPKSFKPNVKDNYYALVSAVPIVLIIVLITASILIWFFVNKSLKKKYSNNVLKKR